MKLKYITQLLLTALISAVMSRSVVAQLPPIVDSQNNLTEQNNVLQVTASASTIGVSCQDLKTVVQKGDRQAVMVN